MWKKAFAVTVVLTVLLVPTIAAHETDETEHHVDTVILASTENYPDALVAGSAAEKIGAPVLLTEKDALPQEASDALHRMQPSEVVLIGGESVISAAVEETIAESYNTTRLWGVTRYGTAVEVAEQFWVEGTDEALLVQNGLEDRDGELVAAAKELARDEEVPVYLTPEEKVPGAVVTSLQNLDVSAVTVIGTSVSDTYRQALEDVNVSVDEVIDGSDEDAVREKVEDRVTERMNASSRMVVVASSGFQHAIATSNIPHHRVVRVGAEEDIGDVVSVVNDRGVEQVKVVGQPQLADTAANRLRSETDATVDLVVGDAAEAHRINANLTETETPAFVEAQRKKMEQWKERVDARRDRVRERVNETLSRAEQEVDENASEEAQEALSEARRHFENSEYAEAREAAYEAMEGERRKRFRQHMDDPAEVRREMDEEMQSLDEELAELREMNREFAEEMQENMTTEERLELLEELREERREQVEELVDEAQRLGNETREDLRERLRDAENRIRDRQDGERFRFEAECASENQTAGSVSNTRVTGEDGKIVARGDVTLSTPNYDGSGSFEDVGDHHRSMQVSLTERSGFGIQCVGAGKYRYRVDAEAGNWTVDLTVTADGDQLYQDTHTVTVAPDDEGSEDEMSEDLENGTESADE